MLNAEGDTIDLYTAVIHRNGSFERSLNMLRVLEFSEHAR